MKTGHGSPGLSSHPSSSSSHLVPPSSFPAPTRYDLHCTASEWTWASCTGCWLPNSLSHFVSLTLRGLCPRTMFDTSFEVLNDERGYVSYRGRTRTLISYQPGERLWMMKLVNNPRVWAVTNVSMASMLLWQNAGAGISLCKGGVTAMQFSPSSGGSSSN